MVNLNNIFTVSRNQNKRYLKISKSLDKTTQQKVNDIFKLNTIKREVRAHCYNIVVKPSRHFRLSIFSFQAIRRPKLHKHIDQRTN